MKSTKQQSSEYVKAHGQLDLIVEPGEGQDSQEAVEDRLQSIVSLLFEGGGKGNGGGGKGVPSLKEPAVPATKEDMEAARDYTLARKIDRYQAQDVMSQVLEDYVELCGDGKVCVLCEWGGVDGWVGVLRCVGPRGVKVCAYKCQAGSHRVVLVENCPRRTGLICTQGTIAVTNASTRLSGGRGGL